MPLRRVETGESGTLRVTHQSEMSIGSHSRFFEGLKRFSQLFDEKIPSNMGLIHPQTRGLIKKLLEKKKAVKTWRTHGSAFKK